jgi:hypothetical protein
MSFERETSVRPSAGQIQSSHAGKSSGAALLLLRPLFLLGFVVLLFARMPDVLNGRLWAEEGSIFLAAAASHSWWTALWMSHSGYLNIVANAAPLIAWHAVSLENLPYVTIGIALVFQCCPAILLLYANDAWLQPFWVRAAALLIIATPPLVSEVWLHSMHSHFHLGLCCAIILALDIPGRKMAWFSYALLLVAPLCGPAAVAELPLFLARAGFDRSWPRLRQALVLGGATIFQFACFAQYQPGRAYHLSPLYLIYDVYTRQILSPLAGWPVANNAALAIQARIAAHHLLVLPLAVTCAVILLIALGLWRRGNAAFVWLFLAAGATSAVCYYGAFDTGTQMLIPGHEGRYVFIQQVLAGLTILGLATGTRNPDRWIARGLTVWLIAIGILWMTQVPPILGPSWTVNWINHGPAWRQSVAAWRQHPDQPLASWPTGWMTTLPAPK